MKNFFVFTLILIILIISGSCDDFDYFSAYLDKNLISNLDLDSWSASFSDPYMDYSEVSAAVAGTSGLPDSAALIYRLENKNLMPDGDFEAATAGTLPAGWSETNSNTADQVNAGSPIDGQALMFDEIQDEYLTFDISNISDSAIGNSNYMIRFNILGDDPGYYYFRIDDSEDSSTYAANILSSSILYDFPVDFSSVSMPEFLINSDGSDVFRINFSGSDYSQSGYIDNFRIIKSDQDQFIAIEIPYYDENRIDELELISGWYRFSIYVKADPEAGSNNIFATDAVTLSINAFDDEGLASSSAVECLYATNYSSFSEWTNIYIDTNLQITKPEDTETIMIKLLVSPSCTTTGAIGLDAGSILVSTPQLLYSSTSDF